MARHLGTKNLKPVISKEEAIERGRKGGLASVQTHRRKKSMKELTTLLLQTPEKKEVIDKLKEFYPDVSAQDICNGFVMLAKQVEKARKGELASLNFLMEMSGQKPKSDTEINIQNNMETKSINVTFVKPDDLKSQDNNTLEPDGVVMPDGE